MRYQVEVKDLTFELEYGIILNKKVIATIYDDPQQDSSREMRFGYADVNILQSHKEQ